MDSDKYEELAEKLYPDTSKGRSGGRKRGPKSKTSKKAIQLAIGNSQENRVERAKKDLARDLTHFPFVKTGLQENLPVMELYSAWLLESLNQGKPVVKEGDFVYKASHSSGPGGQNVNKVESAITATHQITGIYQKSQTQREQEQNKDNANTLLNTRLSMHIETAKEFLSDVPTPESKHEKVMELLSEMLASKFPETSKVESEKV